MIASLKAMQIEPESNSAAPDPIDVHVGKKLRDRRNLMGLSQEELGSALGLTFQQIQKYERGTNRIAASRLYRLANALNVESTFFFEGLSIGQELRAPGFSDKAQVPTEGVPKKDEEILERRDVKELIRAYDRITDPKKRRIVYDLAKSMAEE